MPDIQLEGTTGHFYWISSQRGLQGSFTGYPANRHSTVVYVDIRQCFPAKWPFLLPDIQLEDATGHIYWISSQRDLQGSFTGYPANRHSTIVCVDIRQCFRAKRPFLLPDIQLEDATGHIYWISSQRGLQGSFTGYPARGHYKALLPDIQHVGRGRRGQGAPPPYTANVLSRSQEAMSAGRRGERVRKTRSL